jgi:hypothetical protein
MKRGSLCHPPEKKKSDGLQFSTLAASAVTPSDTIPHALRGLNRCLTKGTSCGSRMFL